MSTNMLGNLRLPDIQGLLGDLIIKLAGEEGEKWLKALKWFLRKENPWPKFSVWKRIIIGGKSGEGLTKRIDEAAFYIDDNARSIITHPTFPLERRQRELILIRCEVGNLGFTDLPTTIELFDRIKEVGKLCPAETGFCLREQYPDQPIEGGFLVAMESLRGPSSSRNKEHIFMLWRDEGRLGLGTLDGDPNRDWALKDEVVFCLN